MINLIHSRLSSKARNTFYSAVVVLLCLVVLGIVIKSMRLVIILSIVPYLLQECEKQLILVILVKLNKWQWCCQAPLYRVRDTLTEAIVQAQQV